MAMTHEQLSSTDARDGAHDGSWVVGIDGSLGAQTALDWAAANAVGRASGLRLVTAWQTPALGTYPVGGPLTSSFEDPAIADAVGADLQRIAAELGSRLSVPVEPLIVHGGPTAALLEAAQHGSLLVLGSRGRGGFGRLLLGSTSTQCATHATVPTVVIPQDHEPHPVRRVLVGCDGSPNSLAALQWAIDFAAPGTSVRVAWVWDTSPLAVGADNFFFPDAADLSNERFNHLVDGFVSAARAREVVIERRFLRGTPRTVLAEAGATADLVVVGARGHGAVGAALLGSVSTWLLHHGHRPLAVVPDAKLEVELVA